MYNTKAPSFETVSRTLDLGNDGGRTLFCAGTGAITLTLPPNDQANPNAWFLFVNTVAQNMIIAKPTSGTIGGLIAFNNLTASTITFSTAGNLIGAALLVKSHPTIPGSWVAINISGATQTVA